MARARMCSLTVLKRFGPTRFPRSALSKVDDYETASVGYTIATLVHLKSKRRQLACNQVWCRGVPTKPPIVKVGFEVNGMCLCLLYGPNSELQIL